MEEGSFPSAARRFDSVGFSEIVQVRNRVLALLAAGHKVWRFEGGEPYMPTPEPIKAAMSRALLRNETRYAPSSGVPELRQAIVEKVRRKNGIPADAESPIVVNGGMHGLFAAFATLLDPGDDVLMFSPYWTPIADVIAYHGATPVLVGTDAARAGGLSSALARAVTPKTKLLYWNSPVNPTGEVFTREECEEVCAFARDRGLAVISDEAYEDLIYEGDGHVSPASFPGMADRTISVFTLSKTYSMTGWRAGYVIVPERWRPPCCHRSLYQWSRTPRSGRCSTPSGSRRFPEGAGGRRQRRDRLQAQGRRLRDHPAPPRLHFRVSGASRRDLRSPPGDLLDRARVATVPGIVFGPEGEGHLRFTFSVAEKMIEGGVDALRAFATASAR